jgi:Sulfotransferase family
VLATLFAGDFDRYFAEAGAGNPLWLFVHVPKTAGSSMEVEMSAILKPNGHIEIDYTDTSKTYQVLFDEAVQRFVARHQAEPYRFATGHIVARHTDMLRAAIPELRCFSMLRSPVARIISDYRYQRSSMNTARENFVRVTPDFATYVARKHVHNKTAKALVPLPLVEAGDIEAAVEFILKNFVFIGLQEMYPLSLRAITTMAGQSRSPEAKVRVNNESDDNRVELSPKEEADLRRLNAVDVGIYNAFLERWRPIRDDLRTYLTTHPRTKAA